MSSFVPLTRVQQPVSSQGQRWRPQPFESLPGELDRHELDLALKTIYDVHYTLEQSAVGSISTGTRMASGAISVTGSVKAVASGLTTLSNIVVSIDAGSVATNQWVTATPSATVPGAFDVFVWMPTSSGNNTPIASTAVTVIRWHAWGT